MKYDVITIGAGVRDVFMLSKQFRVLKTKELGLSECVPLGAKIEIDDLLLTTGGGATNAAATLSSLGLKTACICRVGDDAPGQAVINDLKSYKVHTGFVRVIKNGQTGYSTLLTEPKGERSVLVHRGVSKEFKLKDINTRSCHISAWTYLTSLGGNAKLSKSIVTMVDKCHNSLMWNPGSAELSEGMDYFSPLLPKISILNMNKEEGMKLTGAKTIPQIMKKLARPGNVVIITDGPRGTYAMHNGELLHAKTTGAKSISRTGAGDAFGSGFLAGWIKTQDLSTSLQLGTLNAESVIQSLGAKQGILTKIPSKAILNKVKVVRK